MATYDYIDESGGLLFQVVRFEPRGFAQRRPDGKNGCVWNLKETRLVLYHLPDVIKAESVLIVEGEKDADALHWLYFDKQGASTNTFSADVLDELRRILTTLASATGDEKPSES